MTKGKILNECNIKGERTAVCKINKSKNISKEKKSCLLGNRSSLGTIGLRATTIHSIGSSIEKGEVVIIGVLTLAILHTRHQASLVRPGPKAKVSRVKSSEHMKYLQCLLKDALAQQLPILLGLPLDTIQLRVLSEVPAKQVSQCMLRKTLRDGHIGVASLGE